MALEDALKKLFKKGYCIEYIKEVSKKYNIQLPKEERYFPNVFLEYISSEYMNDTSNEDEDLDSEMEDIATPFYFDSNINCCDSDNSSYVDNNINWDTNRTWSGYNGGTAI